MILILPNGDVVDLTGKRLSFVPGTPAAGPSLALDGTLLYTPVSATEWMEMQSRVTNALINRMPVLSLAVQDSPLLNSVAPNPVVYTGGDTVTVGGLNFDPAIAGTLYYPNLSGSALPVANLTLTWVDATQVTFVVPALPDNTHGPAVITFINPDGGLGTINLDVF